MKLHPEISIVKPKKLRIDLTSFCQLKCPTCPMTYKPISACFIYHDMKKTGQYIPLEKIKQLYKRPRI